MLRLTHQIIGNINRVFYTLRIRDVKVHHQVYINYIYLKRIKHTNNA